MLVVAVHGGGPGPRVVLVTAWLPCPQPVLPGQRQAVLASTTSPTPVRPASPSCFAPVVLGAAKAGGAQSHLVPLWASVCRTALGREFQKRGSLLAASTYHPVIIYCPRVSFLLAPCLFLAVDTITEVRGEVTTYHWTGTHTWNLRKMNMNNLNMQQLFPPCLVGWCQSL